MGAIAEWLGERFAAPAKGKVCLTRQVKLLALGIDQRDGASGRLYTKRAIISNRNFDIRHSRTPKMQQLEVRNGLLAPNC
jgi:hypothetical protein